MKGIKMFLTAKAKSRLEEQFIRFSATGMQKMYPDKPTLN